MDRPVPPPRAGSRHLEMLLSDADRLAARVERRPEEDRERVARELTTRCALASLRLDGSSITEPPPPRRLDELESARWRAASRGSRDGHEPVGWAATLRSATTDGEDEIVQGLEYLGVCGALRSHELGERLLDDPRAGLAALHRELTRGLVDPWHAGRPRRTDQAVHDGSIGRVVYFTPRPPRARAELDRLCDWLTSEAARREHRVVVSGILHLELLRLHPFDSANGRLARTAGRLWLRAHGGDPDGLAATELVLERDPLGTYEEVASTRRRGDCTIWLERWAEAVTGGLREAARRLGVPPPTLPDRGAQFLARRLEPRFDLADYTTTWNVDADQARKELRILVDAGRLHLVPGSRGLEFEIAEPPDQD